VGSTRDLRFDVRVITATNQNLDGLADEGRFRRELLYRLKVFQIELPPLRERGDDVLELAGAFTEQFARSFRKPIRGFDDVARETLAGYSFPGNVRELRNIIEQAVILTRGELITCEALSLPRGSIAPDQHGTEDATPKLSLEDLGESPLRAAEIELVRQALTRSGGNKQRAAKLLGISRFALQRKLEKYAVELLGLEDD
jgi:two-component system response regulator PilR (NtrC family)